MKYIRAQDGQVYSVSQLMMPSKGITQEDIWRLSLITVDGKRQTYAIYSDHDVAQAVYRFAQGFIASSYLMLEFELGVEGRPSVYDGADELRKQIFQSLRKTDGDQ